MMQPTYTLVESPDDGGWYAEFWDWQTGKGIVDTGGNKLHSEIYLQRYQANKAARRIRRDTDWTQYRLQEGPGTVSKMMFLSGEKRREFWTYCSEECARVHWNDRAIEDREWLGKQDIATLFTGYPGHTVIHCDTCKKELSTRGYTAEENINPTDIIWWWER